MNCSCDCHVGGAYRPPCNVPGGCGCGNSPANDGPLCVLPHRAEQRNAAPAALVCAQHARKLRDLPTTIREDWLHLALIIEAGTAPKDAAPKTRHTKSDSPPAPVNLDVLVLRDKRTKVTMIPARGYKGPDLPKSDGDQSKPAENVMFVVASWVLLVADELPITSALPSSVIAQLDLLEKQTDWISRQAWVDDYWTELSELQQALRYTLRDREHTRIGRCYLPAEAENEGDCRGVLLRQNGSSIVKCVRCRSTWSTPGELARLEIALVQRREA